MVDDRAEARDLGLGAVAGVRVIIGVGGDAVAWSAGTGRGGRTYEGKAPDQVQRSPRIRQEEQCSFLSHWGRAVSESRARREVREPWFSVFRERKDVERDGKVTE